ncbi:UDP-glucose--hexose-1-phosphate uridylyltransferase [Streptococcus sp. SI1]|uniref:Galactose-1-phosphate uridylyltransferase n=1 Tax=Streptococcus intermedius B196 TaxID=862967 RepID=T1ZDP2_STRIT|nr:MULTISPECIES: UDP-glucose--hexose-1-phosphate uridylyltransferase [Streptococcus]AGU76043.1 galactose-1-phosphate uridylyltransferase [Streptococcus intermedius B196]MDN5016367.1 UDP-glucose--hexose-1-phosphate uridylyltransferase [Streptococcus sp. SI1]MDP1433453.1 UDP-glucose--hexose-1-phosphate uridylyltransferase [Streptococcus intermedius]
MSQGVLDAFITEVISESSFEEMDRIYLTNRVLARVGDGVLEVETELDDLIDIKDQLVEEAVRLETIEDSQTAREILGAELMDLITPAPSQLNRDFWTTYASNPEQAVADFYHLSQKNDYIKIKAIAKNIAFKAPTAYGDLEITINLSKPEKDPKEIAAAKKAKTSHYPTCQLCFENEGYQGRLDHPARSNHRIIRFDLVGQEWGFQYSPYAYFNEHCIFLDSKHTPMTISRATFERLLDIVEIFPSYFAGSNADLPIVGGSILTHDHYQGGRHTFPMEKANLDKVFTFVGFETVEAGIVNWPMSVLRLKSTDKAALIKLSDTILQKWRAYSDPTVQILAESNGEQHHTITPIARRKKGKFELDLVLRDNQTSKEHPDGIYHPHKDVQHIKKENIGLIEVMGLAILPPRLKNELKEVEEFLLGQREEVAPYHQAWADQLKAHHPDVTLESAQTIVRASVGRIFKRVLEDAGVYKRTKEGQAAFMRFIESIGLVK